MTVERANQLKGEGLHTACKQLCRIKHLSLVTIPGIIKFAVHFGMLTVGFKSQRNKQNMYNCVTIQGGL